MKIDEQLAHTSSYGSIKDKISKTFPQKKFV